jgi:hypothetical protein
MTTATRGILGVVLTQIGLRVALAAVGVGTLVLVWHVATDLPGQVVGYALGALFLVLATLLVLTDLARLRARRGAPGDAPAAETPDPPTAPDQATAPKPAEWAVLVLLDGFTAALTVAGALELRSTGEADLLVLGGIGWLVFLGPTAGVLSRWWRHRA